MTLDELQRICDAPLLLGPFVAKWPAKGRGTVYDAVGNVVADYYDEGVGPWIVAARAAMLQLIAIARAADALAFAVEEVEVYRAEAFAIQDMIAALETK